MAAPVLKLEFCQQPLSTSNAAATWIDVTTYCQGVSWTSGVSREFDDPQAGGATINLKNLQRRFEPDYTAGAYYPNIVPGRRFRVTVDGVQQGVYYAQSWEVGYPDRGSSYSTVTVTCSDGFWRLAIDSLPYFSPPSATTYADVVTADNPVAYYRLAETGGRKMAPETGPDGVYRGAIDLGANPNPVLGDAATAIVLQTSGATMGRAKMDDVNIFQDANAFTIEAVVNNTSGGPLSDPIAAGPQNATGATFSLFADSANLIGGTSTLINTGGSNLSTGRHHLAATWDGQTLTHWVDGSVHATATTGLSLATPTAGEYLYVGSPAGGGVGGRFSISHVAFYNYPLIPAQIASHSNAALNHGYDAATSGTRIAALATDSLWSTAGIPAGTVTAAARFQAGQSALDEIATTAKIEQPGSLFYFDDSGNPDYRALQDSQTVSATFGDTAGEVGYDAIQLVYNDELYNSSTVAGEGLDGATAQNSTSISDYGVRAQDSTGLIITSDADARLLSQAVVDGFSTPRFRCDSISLNGANAMTRTQILNREVGDTIRVRRRGDGGTPIDVITRILAKEKTLTVDGDLRCTWTLARGFNASLAVDHLSVVGYSELNSNFLLA